MKYAMEGVESVHARIEFDFVYACYVSLLVSVMAWHAVCFLL